MSTDLDLAQEVKQLAERVAVLEDVEALHSLRYRFHHHDQHVADPEVAQFRAHPGPELRPHADQRLSVGSRTRKERP
jgi:hypothetical protein